MEKPADRLEIALKQALPADHGALVDHVAAAPSDAGTVELVVARPATGERLVLDRGELRPGIGLVGDNYLERGSSKPGGGPAHPLAELNLMTARALQAVAGAARDLVKGDACFDQRVLGRLDGATVAVQQHVSGTARPRQAMHVAESAPAFLDVGFEQERHLTKSCCPFLPCRGQFAEPAVTSANPVGASCPCEIIGQREIAGQMTDGEQCGRGVEVLRRQS